MKTAVALAAAITIARKQEGNREVDVDIRTIRKIAGEDFSYPELAEALNQIGAEPEQGSEDHRQYKGQPVVCDGGWEGTEHTLYYSGCSGVSGIGHSVARIVDAHAPWITMCGYSLDIDLYTS